MITLDDVDIKIISLLQSDAKMSIKSIAEKVNMTKTPIYERIRRLEETGVIEKYVALVDRKKVNGGMLVFCSVSLEVQKLPEIESFKEERISVTPSIKNRKVYIHHIIISYNTFI